MTTTSGSRPRIVFLGTAEFGIPSLKILLDNQYTVVAVVTNPDKPAGRGRQLSCSPIKEFASQHSFQILQPESLRDVAFIQQLKLLQPDLLVVVAFRILPPEVFTTARLGAFNLHASLLPKYRGAAPIQWAIINGEKETGVTTFLLEEKVDTGNVVLQARIPIGENDTAGEIHDKLSEIGAEIVLHTVRLIESGKAVPKPQDPAAASRAPKIFKDDCRIDWDRTAVEVHNHIRGLSPRPGAFTMHQGNTIKMYRSRILKDSKATRPGEILQADRQLVVSTKDGAVEIFELQQEGKSKMPAEAFLRGYRLHVSEKFSS
jgi:methionyl-tRNA formyltransferase